MLWTMALDHGLAKLGYGLTLEQDDEVICSARRKIVVGFSCAVGPSFGFHCRFLKSAAHALVNVGMPHAV